MCSLLIDRSMFPTGIPDQFSFVTTFRMKGKANREKWNLIQIRDLEGNPQWGIRLDGQKKEVDFHIINFDGTLQRLTFTKAKKVRRRCVSCIQGTLCEL